MLKFSTIIFFLALILFLVKNNFIFILFGLEIMVLAININFIFASLYLNDFSGQLLALTLFSLAASDTAFGLALLLNYYNNRSNPLPFFSPFYYVKKKKKYHLIMKKLRRKLRKLVRKSIYTFIASTSQIFRLFFDKYFYSTINFSVILFFVILFFCKGFFSYTDDVILGIAFFILLSVVISYSRDLIKEYLRRRREKIIHDVLFNLTLIEKNLKKRELWFIIQIYTLRRFYWHQHVYFFEKRIKKILIDKIKYQIRFHKDKK